MPSPRTRPARYAKLKKGECHVMIAPNPADIAGMKTDPVVNLISQPGLNIGYLSFNTQKPPFDKKEVRQAFNMAIDKAAIIKDVYQGAGQAAINRSRRPSGPTTPRSRTIPTIREGQEDAGRCRGEDAARHRSVVDAGAAPYNPNAKRIAEIMQADLAKIGVNAKLVSYEWGEYRKRLQQGEHMTGQLGWTGDNGDPDNFFFLLGCAAARPGGQNLSKWCNKDFDALINKAKTISDTAERTKLYEQAQVIVKEEAPWFTIAHSVVYEPTRKEVVDYKVSPLGRHEFYGVDLK